MAHKVKIEPEQQDGRADAESGNFRIIELMNSSCAALTGVYRHLRGNGIGRTNAIHRQTLRTKSDARFRGEEWSEDTKNSGIFNAKTIGRMMEEPSGRGRKPYGIFGRLGFGEPSELVPSLLSRIGFTPRARPHEPAELPKESPLSAEIEA